MANWNRHRSSSGAAPELESKRIVAAEPDLGEMMSAATGSPLYVNMRTGICAHFGSAMLMPVNISTGELDGDPESTQ